MTSMKHCPKCGRDLPADTVHFPPSKQRPDGLFGWCRDCKRGGDRQSHADHRETRTRKMRERYQANPEPQRARSREQARANPEANRARATAWNKANRDRRRAIVRAHDARVYATNPEIKRERWRARNALIRKGVNGGQISVELLAGKLDYYGGMCRWCRFRPATDWDHVKPLSKGGAHILANLTPACGPCNGAKHNLWPLKAWLLRLPQIITEAAAAV